MKCESNSLSLSLSLSVELFDCCQSRQRRMASDWWLNGRAFTADSNSIIIQSTCSINTTCRRYMTCLETNYCRLYTGVAGIVIGAWMRRPNGQRWLSFVRRPFTSPIPVKSPRQYPPQMTLCMLFITIVKQRHCDWNRLICSMPCFGCALNPYGFWLWRAFGLQSFTHLPLILFL